MRKNLIAAALLSLVASTSFAADNGPFVGIDVTSIKNTDFGSSTNAFGVSGGYRHFLSEKVSAEAVMSYSQYTTEGGKEKIILPQVGLGYDYAVNDKLVLRPKVRVGYGTVKASMDEQHETMSTVGVALEASFHKNFSVEYSFKNMKAEEFATRAHQLSLNYKF